MSIEPRKVTQYRARCKDCGEWFSYDAAVRASMEAVGQSAPERCPEHRRTHAREARAMAMSHFELKPRQGTKGPIVVRSPGIGRVWHTDRTHEASETMSDPSGFDVGITDDDIRAFFDEFSKPGVQVAIVEGATGSGKSTMLPFRLLCPPAGRPENEFTGSGPIVLTEPTIQATQRTARTISSKLHGGGLGAGQEIGYRHGKGSEIDPRNKLVVVTDGTLINWIKDGSLGSISTVIIDEAHERSTNIDLCMGLLRLELPRWPHLRLIIASATIEVGVFLEYFKECGAFHYEFKGKVPRYEVRHWGEDIGHPHEESPVNLEELRTLEDTKAVLAAVNQKVRNILLDPERLDVPSKRGDILVFLPTKRMIEVACQTLTDQLSKGDLARSIRDKRLGAGVVVYPLHNDLSIEEQETALAPASGGETKVVFATTIAETSLTVQNLSFVVDSGLVMHPMWDPSTASSVPETKTHSQAGCKQRWGRVGRDNDGWVYTVYTRQQFEAFEEYTKPTIERSCMNDLVLAAKEAGVVDLEHFPWITQPIPGEIARAEMALAGVGALDADGDITEQGIEIRRLSKLGPEWAKAVMLADELSCVVEVATLASMVNVKSKEKLLLDDPKWDAATRHHVSLMHEWLRRGCTDDVDLLLRLFQGWSTAEDPSGWARRAFTSHARLSQADLDRRAILDALSGHKKDDEIRALDFSLLERVRLVLTAAMPERVYGPSPEHETGEGEHEAAARSNGQIQTRPPGGGEPVTASVESSSCLFGKLNERPWIALTYRSRPDSESASPSISAGIAAVTNAGWIQAGDGTPISLAMSYRLAEGPAPSRAERESISRTAMLACDVRYGDVWRAVPSAEPEGGVVLTEPLEQSPAWRATMRDWQSASANPPEEGSDSLELTANIGFLSDEDGDADQFSQWAFEDDWDELVASGQPATTATLSSRLGERSRVGVPSTRLTASLPPGASCPDDGCLVAVVDCNLACDNPSISVCSAEKFPTRVFSERFQVGDEVELEPLRPMHLGREEIGWLFREPISGLEIILEAGELTVSTVPRDRQSRDSESLIEHGAHIAPVLYQAPCEQNGDRPRLSLVERMSDGIASQLRAAPAIPAVVVRPPFKQDKGKALGVRLLVKRSADALTAIPRLNAFIPSGLTRDFELGDQVWVTARRPRRITVDLAGLDVSTELIQEYGLELGPDCGTLVAASPLTSESWRKLRARFGIDQSTTAIDRMYFESNRIALKVVDPGEYAAFSRMHRVGDTVVGVPVSLTSQRGVVSFESGVRALIDWHDPDTTPLRIGEPSTFVVRKMSEDPSRSLRLIVEPVHEPEHHPISRYQEGQTVRVRVVGIGPSGGLDVFVEPGVEGEVRRDSIARGRPTDYVGSGWLEARVLDVNYDSRRLGLELCSGTSAQLVSESQPVEAFVERMPSAEDYELGQMAVAGVVTQADEDRARVVLDDGVSAVIPRAEATWCAPGKVFHVLPPGDRIENARVETIDRQGNTLELSLRTPGNDPDHLFASGSTVQARVTGNDGRRAFFILPGHNLASVSLPAGSAEVFKRGAVVDVRVLGVFNVGSGDRRQIAAKLVDGGSEETDAISATPARRAPAAAYTVGQAGIEGTVSEVSEARVVIRLDDGVRGILQLDELTWCKAPKKAFHAFKKGDRVEDAQVVAVEAERNSLELTLRTPANDPLRLFEPGETVQGMVTGTDERNVFLRLAGCNSAVLALSEHPRELFGRGLSVAVRVLEVLQVAGDRRSIRAKLSSEPGTVRWDPDAIPAIPAALDYSLGQGGITGTVVATSEASVCIILEDGVRGTIPLKELTWCKPPKMAFHAFRKGDRVQNAQVTAVDAKNDVLEVTLRTPGNDPRVLFEVGGIVEGVVTGWTDNGAFVRLPGHNTGYISRTRLGGAPSMQPAQLVSKGLAVRVRIADVRASADGRCEIAGDLRV